MHGDLLQFLQKGWSQFYVSFMDDYTRYCWVYLMKHCFDFLSIYNAFQALVKTQHYAIIKCFRCDLSGVHTSNAFNNYLLHMELFTTLLLLTLHSKMVLLKGNINILLKLLVIFYWLHVFLVNIGGN